VVLQYILPVHPSDLWWQNWNTCVCFVW